ncbi:MAG TPA: aminotransferase class III-fold pyridoxal phosphate-dependent enzyme [Polyangiaceae bacterium]|nr:aminotransferase class III-fold pyridoxal phosphate-dependent enzyme [Polyangiaceae bacterium]
MTRRAGNECEERMTEERYRQSAAWSERAQRVIPGGHHLSGRLLLEADDSPQYMTRARGARCWDVDGNEYIDYVGAYGPFLLGFANEAIDAAAFEQLRRSGLVSLNHPLHVEFAERLVSRIPGAEMATFFKTGSEATTAALRIARAATGRRRVVRCGYHGWHDWCLPLERFVPRGLDEQVLEIQARDADALETALSTAPGIAAVIIAPEMVLPYDPAVFHRLVELTHRYGALFILDEVKTGLRIKPGTFQQFAGLTPDLTTLSKALGNGWPIAAVVGKREIMRHAAGMHLSATFHGDTAAMAAALSTLDFVDRHPVAEVVWELGQRLIDGLNAAARRQGIPAVAFGEPLPPMPFLKFTASEPGLNDSLRSAFYREVYRRGVLLHPRHLWFVSYAHTPADIDYTVQVAEEAFARAARALGARRTW